MSKKCDAQKKKFKIFRRRHVMDKWVDWEFTETTGLPEHSNDLFKNKTQVLAQRRYCQKCNIAEVRRPHIIYTRPY